MSNCIESSDEDHIGLIQQMLCGRIRQIGMTKDQQVMLRLLLGGISKEKPMVLLPEAYDLVLKSEVSQ